MATGPCGRRSRQGGHDYAHVAGEHRAPWRSAQRLGKKEQVCPGPDCAQPSVSVSPDLAASHPSYPVSLPSNPHLRARF